MPIVLKVSYIDGVTIATDLVHSSRMRMIFPEIPNAYQAQRLSVFRRAPAQRLLNLALHPAEEPLAG